MAQILTSSEAGAPTAPDRWILRLAAVATVTGVVSQLILGQLHAGHADPNDSARVFPEYASSQIWTAVHIGQFAGTLLITLGLLAFARLIAQRGGVARALALASAVAFLLVTAVFAVQMAIDGIVLRESISAWIAAAPADKPAAFVVADTVRWIEKALSAFFHLLNGTGLLLLGSAVLASRAFAWWLGIVGIAAGAGFAYGGWVTAHTGFSTDAGSVLGIVALAAVVFLVGGATTMIRTASRPVSTRSVPALLEAAGQRA